MHQNVYFTPDHESQDSQPYFIGTDRNVVFCSTCVLIDCCLFALTRHSQWRCMNIVISLFTYIHILSIIVFCCPAFFNCVLWYSYCKPAWHICVIIFNITDVFFWRVVGDAFWLFIQVWLVITERARLLSVKEMCGIGKQTLSMRTLRYMRALSVSWMCQFN